MSRAIKFRAWEKRTCRMREVSGFFFGQVMFIFPQENATSYTINSVPEDQVELMQFTGLFDRLKIGIYEGDIVRVEDTSIGVIVYSGAEFIIRTNTNRIGLNDLTPMYVEIIGNIYENPELLKKDGDA